MPTTTTPETATLRAALEELRDLAINYAAAEEKVQRAALDEAGWERLLDSGLPSRFYIATSTAIRGALSDARGDHGCSDFTAAQVCRSVVDAWEVFEFAVSRDANLKTEEEV